MAFISFSFSYSGIFDAIKVDKYLFDQFVVAYRLKRPFFTENTIYVRHKAVRFCRFAIKTNEGE